MRMAAIYARVSSDKQKEEKTIVSQTEALIEFAKKEGFNVPAEWILQDDGYSGTNLIRPGLERVRDLAAEGEIQAVLAYSPDRLSRKYAYQVLLIEEFTRCGVEIIFIKTPHTETPEDQLLLQFQGMIAEYEHAQILERSRRGKLHKAKQGLVNVLPCAPYGYRYVRKMDEAPAYYEVIEAEAKVIRFIFELYTQCGDTLESICKRLSELKIPSKKNNPRWTSSTVRQKLCNPAYKGTACFGKTKIVDYKKKLTRHARLQGNTIAGNTASRPTPREQWIEIPVPALVSEETFALAQELLEKNKKFSPRKTIEPTILQGLAYCHHCGYALNRATSNTKTRKIYYYRCASTNSHRDSTRAICHKKPVRLDHVDELVWAEIMKLLEDPTLIQAEIDRRLQNARQSETTKRQHDTLTVELNRIEKSMERLLTAYQEGLVSLDEFRERMPALRQRDKMIRVELQSLIKQTENQAAYLQLAETLSTFLGRLHANAQNLDVLERQRIVRLLVRSVAIGDDRIIIQHSISKDHLPFNDGEKYPMKPNIKPERELSNENYILYSRRATCILKSCNILKSTT